MTYRLLHGDCREVLGTLPDESVHCCVTSPPYFGLRDYGVAGQLGLEETPDAYVANMVQVFRDVRRVLRDDGTLWLNLGDSYAGTGGVGAHRGEMARRKHGARLRTARPPLGDLKPKDLMGIPWRVAFALRADGWYLRQDIIWHKPNPMPESVRDRCTKAHEYLFLLSKSERYYFDASAMQEPATNAGNRVTLGAKSFAERQAAGAGVAPSGNGLADHYDVPATRNKRSVWTIPTRPYRGAHFATFPPELIVPCVRAGCPPGGTVLDTFNGSGTTGAVALTHGRNYIGCELNAEYIALSEQRIGEALCGDLL
jgi:DNA modification methylase